MDMNETNKQIIVRETFGPEYKKITSDVIKRTIELLNNPEIIIEKMSTEKQYTQISETFSLTLPDNSKNIYVILCTKIE